MGNGEAWRQSCVIDTCLSVSGELISKPTRTTQMTLNVSIVRGSSEKEAPQVN